MLHGPDFRPRVDADLMSALQAIQRAGHLYFNSHVYLCRTEDYVVLLDGRRNRFLGIRAADAGALNVQADGWPQAEANTAPPPDAGVNELLTELWEGGLLASSAGISRVQPCAIQPASRALIEGYIDTPVQVNLKDVLSFIVAILAASFMLRWCSFQRISHRFRLRRELQRAPEGSVDAKNKDLARHVAAFRLMYGMLFTGRQACLFNSLMLTEFLARYLLFPACVIGVESAPFAAHCWVQYQGTVLNDVPQEVNRFVPILVL